MLQAGEDFALLKLWADGDSAAGNQLFVRHYASVFRFFELRLPAEAEDLTQRTLLSCIEAVQRQKLHTSFRSYLFGIARNHMLMHLRKASRVDAMRSFGADSPRPSAQTSLTAIFARSEEQKLLLAAMVELPADLQIAMQLYYWDGLRTAEIAEVVEVPKSTVTTRLARARELIRIHLQELRVSPALQASVDGDLPRLTASVVQPQ